jgi:hypothetical protein
VIARGRKCPEISSAMLRLAGLVVDEHVIQDDAEAAYAPDFEKIMISINPWQAR